MKEVRTETYEKLLQGHEVSWSKIIEEHPDIGEVTIPQLLYSGRVFPLPVFDQETKVFDVKLIWQEGLQPKGQGQIVTPLV